MTATNLSADSRGSLLWCVAALSGAAGLGYEMVWTRLLGVAMGTEMWAVLGAIAGLFAGLALGGWWLDGWVARAVRPGIRYAQLEAVIALWGLVCTQLLPDLAHALPPLLGPLPSVLSIGVLYFVVPALVLLPATVAMGGTLAALTRMLEAARHSQRVVASAYAANTLGAVLGTLRTVWCLFPVLGLRGTLLVLAGLNLLAAAIAWRIAPLGGAAVGLQSVVDTSAVQTASGDRRRFIALFSTGFLGVGIEVLLIRVAAQFLSDTIYTFAGLLAAYLLGSAVGGAWRQAVRVKADSASRSVLLGLTATTVLATVACIPMLARWVLLNALTDRWGETLVSMALFLPSALTMGALYADLLEDYRRAHATVGRANAVNALGAALAPGVVALILIPALGAMAAILGLAVAYLALVSVERRSLFIVSAPLLIAAGLYAVGVVLPVSLPTDGRQVASIEGPMVAASVVDDAQGARYLEVNGHLRMGGTSSERSDFRQALLPLLLHPNPQHALYLGVGTGATLSGAMMYPALVVTGIEISEEVAALLPYFVVPGRPDPQSQVLVADARRYLAADRATYDVIVADNFHPALEGSGSLYSVEHFSAVRARLAPGGLFCQWLPLYQLDQRSLRDIMRTYLSVFAHGSAWLAHFSIRMPMLALCGTADGRDETLLENAVAPKQPALQPVLQRLDFAAPLALAGSYLGDAGALRRYAGPGQLNTDDHPIVALNGSANIAALAAPVQTLLLDLVHAMRTSESAIGRAEPASNRLPAYWQARDRFLEAGAALRGQPRGRALIDEAAPGLLATVAVSADFEPAYQPLLRMADALATTDPTAAQTLLRAIDAAAPSRSEARERLQRLR